MPSIAISNIESLGKEEFTRNGCKKSLHVVVKNIPFSIRLSASQVDLRKSLITTKLFYDFDSLELNDTPKEVETLKNTPIDYICHVEDEKSCTIEVRLGVLSSAHEGSFFRIKVIASDESRKKKFEEYSDPIKVFSKRSQVEQRTVKRKSEVVSTKRKRQPASSDEECSSPSNAVMEVLGQLHEQQKQQTLILRKLTENNNNKSAKLDLTGALAAFLEAFRQTPEADRRWQLEKVITELSNEDKDTVTQFVGQCNVNLLGEGVPSCGPQCTHQSDLKSLDAFYAEFGQDSGLGNSSELKIESIFG